MTNRSQNPLVAIDDENDDARNVDDQLDEVMQLRDEAARKQFLANHSNNARVEPRRVWEPPEIPLRGTERE